eukprot:TRINITY_DN9078_c0_g2_i1.p1 TRINITY_DN9078_c0_g2~~TRINITY_DN9078_c0_g2_i1.p1  ORF type:complete len:121 (-),score=5.44 TRINITY_DN9078_c0_g2_i1:241-564(-)
MDYKDLMDGYESISRDFPLPQYSISILHGKMKPADKDAEMKRFSEGKTNIMVATTVIEVGVNVPNASVMIIVSAERFGFTASSITRSCWSWCRTKLLYFNDKPQIKR